MRWLPTKCAFTGEADASIVDAVAAGAGGAARGYTCLAGTTWVGGWMGAWVDASAGHAWHLGTLDTLGTLESTAQDAVRGARACSQGWQRAHMRARRWRPAYQTKACTVCRGCPAGNSGDRGSSCSPSRSSQHTRSLQAQVECVRVCGCGRVGVGRAGWQLVRAAAQVGARVQGSVCGGGWEGWGGLTAAPVLVEGLAPPVNMLQRVKRWGGGGTLPSAGSPHSEATQSCRPHLQSG